MALKPSRTDPAGRTVPRQGSPFLNPESSSPERPGAHLGTGVVRARACLALAGPGLGALRCCDYVSAPVGFSEFFRLPAQPTLAGPSRFVQFAAGGRGATALQVAAAGACPSVWSTPSARSNARPGSGSRGCRASERSVRAGTSAAHRHAPVSPCHSERRPCLQKPGRWRCRGDPLKSPASHPWSGLAAKTCLISFTGRGDLSRPRAVLYPRPG